MSLTENQTAVEMEITEEMVNSRGTSGERVFEMAPRPLYSIGKGLLDRLLALLAVLVLLPVLTIIALCVRLDSPGGAIYRREQVGKNGKKFTAYKFRSMRINNDDREYKAYLVKYILDNKPYQVDENGKGIFKVVDDPRVTKIGGLLRRTNLDELPQLFNVLRGEMSFVGPRPDIPYSVNMYKEWHRKRLEVIPGITGLWQVSGRKCLSFEDMVRMDLEYIEKRSMVFDIRIMLLTIGTILKGDGS
jgi:lipopolysaccharide/colanic/teichoic acid biosynthesis glycosyltransferase